jgi:hypothetical protein
MIGIGLSIWGDYVITFSAISTLYVGVSATITVSVANAEGQTLSLTVDGETWGSGTVSGGSVAITATPTSAMVGTGVAVVATLSGATASTTANVLTPAVSLVTVPSLLYTGYTQYEIAGTSNVEGGTVSVELGPDGSEVAFGTAVVSSGAWSVTAVAPVLAASLTANVNATILTASDTDTTEVWDPSLLGAARVGDWRRGLGLALDTDPGYEDTVIDWVDRSSAAHVLHAPAAARQPLSTASGLVFDGAVDPDTDWLRTDTTIGNAVGVQSELLAAVTFRASSWRDAGILSVGWTGVSYEWIAFNQSAIGVSLLARDSDDSGNLVTVGTSALSDTAEFHTMVALLSSGAITGYLDGELFATRALGPVDLTATAISLGIFYSTVYPFAGTISHVLVASGNQSANLARIHGWLGANKP